MGGLLGKSKEEKEQERQQQIKANEAEILQRFQRILNELIEGKPEQTFGSPPWGVDSIVFLKAMNLAGYMATGVAITHYGTDYFLFTRKDLIK